MVVILCSEMWLVCSFLSVYFFIFKTLWPFDHWYWCLLLKYPQWSFYVCYLFILPSSTVTNLKDLSFQFYAIHEHQYQSLLFRCPPVTTFGWSHMQLYDAYNLCWLSSSICPIIVAVVMCLSASFCMVKICFSHSVWLVLSCLWCLHFGLESWLEVCFVLVTHGEWAHQRTFSWVNSPSNMLVTCITANSHVCFFFFHLCRHCLGACCFQCIFMTVEVCWGSTISWTHCPKILLRSNTPWLDYQSLIFSH